MSGRRGMQGGIVVKYGVIIRGVTPNVNKKIRDLCSKNRGLVILGWKFNEKCV